MTSVGKLARTAPHEGLLKKPVPGSGAALVTVDNRFS
jgi:hypothetical protein